MPLASSSSVFSKDDFLTCRPDRTLIVKCQFDRWNKRITFSSARNCSYNLLRDRVEQCFSLSASSFVISYKDDDGEITDITNEADLTEAIHYFHTDASASESASSASSILSGRSFGSKKITVRVQVTVDYDGPSLSDSSSLASLDDYQRRSGGSELSLSWSAPGSELNGVVEVEHELEDDAVTISSRDTGASAEHERLNGHIVREHPALPPVVEDQSDIGTEWANETVADNRTTSPSLGSSSEDPSAVFSRLKLAESSSTHPNPSSSSVPLSWLQDQNNRTIKAMLGALPEPSETSTERSSISSIGDLALRRDERGKYYYSYTSASSGSVTQDSGYRDDDSLDVTYDPTRSSMQVNGNPFVDPPNARSYNEGSRGTSNGGSTGYPASSSSSGRAALAHSASEPALQIHPSIPPEVLKYLDEDAASPVSGPPLHELTSCSECGVMLETIRYVCATCGEKRPVSQRDQGGESPSEYDAGFINGNGQLYPPNGHRTPSSTNSSRTYVADPMPPVPPMPPLPHTRYANDAQAHHHHHHSHQYHQHLHHYNPVDPRYHQHTIQPPPRTSSHAHSASFSHRAEAHLHSIFSGSVPGRRGPYMPLASTTTLHRAANQTSTSLPSSYNGNGNGHSSSPSSSSSGSGSSPTTPTVSGGYELCSGCVESAGVNHALEVVGTGGMTFGLGRGGRGGARGMDALSQWRRAAPRVRGQLRHAYVEKVWGSRGWEDVEQDNKRSCKCSTCGTDIVSKRYKCASCQDFNLCIACYGQVHEVHPSHAFLVVPDKPVRSKSESDIIGSSGTTAVDSDPCGGEPSMKHPGVKCAHCMQDIVGARFHCAICESVDICSNCESAGLPGNLDSTDDGHNSSHIMIKIPYPLESTEVQTASKRAKHLWTGRDAAKLGCVPCQDSPDMSCYAQTVVGSSTKGSDGGRSSMDHRILCDGCDRSIVGVRYQCASCPSLPKAYSLCAHCEERSYLVHDPMHVFVKLPRPVDRPLQTNTSLLPPIYIRPVGPPPRSLRGAHPKDYLQSVLHTHTWCDRCMTRIQGEWFHCGFCPKDLCSDCEAMDTHDNTHVFLVLKAPVDLRFFKRDAEYIDNGSGAPRPIIPYPIYRS